MTRPFRLLVLAAPLMALSVAATAQERLVLGYYVQADVPCAEASNATLALVHWTGMNASRVACDFTAVTELGPNTYSYTETCTELMSGDQFQQAGTLQIGSPEFFVLITESGVFRYRHCAQSDLPEPWQSNDISDYKD